MTGGQIVFWVIVVIISLGIAAFAARRIADACSFIAWLAGNRECDARHDEAVALAHAMLLHDHERWGPCWWRTRIARDTATDAADRLREQAECEAEQAGARAYGAPNWSPRGQWDNAPDWLKGPLGVPWQDDLKKYYGLLKTWWADDSAGLTFASVQPAPPLEMLEACYWADQATKRRSVHSNGLWTGLLDRMRGIGITLEEYNNINKVVRDRTNGLADKKLMLYLHDQLNIAVDVGCPYDILKAIAMYGIGEPCDVSEYKRRLAIRTEQQRKRGPITCKTRR